jgi:ATP-dependent DNA helicase PIF1
LATVSSQPSGAPRSPDRFVPTPEMEQAFRSIESNQNLLLILGKAGTGKSTFIRELTRRYGNGLVLLAPTGIAALNIEGQTIHSFFRLEPSFQQLDRIEKSRQPELYQHLKLLVIDEISMVRADLMDAVDIALRRNRDQSDRPFGGVKVVLIGDLHQLPPVVAKTEEAAFREGGRYPSRYFFSSDVIQAAIAAGTIECIEFSRVFRQADSGFIQLLEEIRNGALSGPAAQLLERRVIPAAERGAIKGLTFLTCRRREAELYNSQKLDAVGGAPHRYSAVCTGDFTRLGEDECPNLKELYLKKGAQVLFIRNSPTRDWVNGTLGRVKKLKSDCVLVESDGEELPVEREIWYRYRYEMVDKKLVKVETGEFHQFPVKLGWAMTIHKSQGLTLRNIYLDTGNGAFDFGQIYVALSRVRSIDNLYLKQSIVSKDLIPDTRIRSFMAMMLGKTGPHQ